MTWLSRLTGRRHHFKVVLRYYPTDDGTIYVERINNVWFSDRGVIADDRKIKRALARDMIFQTPRHVQKNGDLKIWAVYYLGWFKPTGGRDR